MDMAYHLHPQVSPKSTALASTRPSACTACRDAHTACDLGRPCARCTRLGKQSSCCDAPPRKRVRTSGNGGGGQGSTHASSKRQAKESNIYAPRIHQAHQQQQQQHQPSSHHHHHQQPLPQQQQQHQSSSSPSEDPWMTQRSLKAPTAADGAEITTLAGFYHDIYAHQHQQQHQQPEDSKASIKHIKQQQPHPRPHSQPQQLQPLEYQQQQQQQQQRLGEGAAAAAAADGTHTGLEEKVERLTRLVDTLYANVDQLQRSNAELVNRVARLEDVVRNNHNNNGNGNSNGNGHRQGNNGHVSSPASVAGELPSTSPRSTPPLSAGHQHNHHQQTMRLEAGVSPALAMEARQNLPWLCHYDLPTRFAISSFSMYPVCVMEQRYTWEQPTVLSYANAAFADLTLYSMDELIGTYYPTLFSLPAQVQRFGSVLYNQRPMVASELINFCLLLRRKDGATLRMRDQSQIFYNSDGQAQYVVMCFHGWQPGQLTQDEVLGHWLPLPNPKLDPPSSSSHSSSSSSSPAALAVAPWSRPRAVGHPRLTPVSPAELADSTFDMLDQLSGWPPTPTPAPPASSSSSSASSSSSSSSQSAYPQLSGYTFFGP